LADFLLYYETIPGYTKSHIDKGATPSTIYKICSCIRETFCLSYGIRKNNNLYLFIQDKNVLVNFNGNELKYLGPDERSQALLLNKALEKVFNNSKFKNDKWIESTPGIRVRFLKNFNSFLLFLNSLNSQRLIFICDPLTFYEMPFLYHMFDLPKIKKFNQLKHFKDSFFFFPENNQVLSEFLKSLVHIYPSMLELVTLVPLKKTKAMEEKILYINFQIDQIGSTK
jgi:hypothetical protein